MSRRKLADEDGQAVSSGEIEEVGFEALSSERFVLACSEIKEGSKIYQFMVSPRKWFNSY